MVRETSSSIFLSGNESETFLSWASTWRSFARREKETRTFCKGSSLHAGKYTPAPPNPHEESESLQTTTVYGTRDVRRLPDVHARGRQGQRRFEKVFSQHAVGIQPCRNR